MQVVCKDTESNGDPSVWFYDAGQYCRIDEKGNSKASINGEEIPDPQALWEARLKAAGAADGSVQIHHPKTGLVTRLKPTEAAFKLYQHWQGVKSCQP